MQSRPDVPQPCPSSRGLAKRRHSDNYAVQLRDGQSYALKNLVIPKTIRQCEAVGHFMTKKLFWEDPYCTELQTRITAVNGETVTVADTILYALSGGQESDTGTIGGYSVTEARADGREIYYQLAMDHGLSVGDGVAMAIDWKRRYRLMRLHFAAEIVLELIYRDFGPIEKIGAHISENKARIDFTWDGNIAEIIPILEEQAREIFDSDLPIASEFSNESAQRRCWRIEGFAEVPCGGTHLKKTGEVGAIMLKRKNPGKGKERIEISLV
jgi:alanyl-tRNA synthetase